MCASSSGPRGAGSGTRIVWEARIPERASLDVSLALAESAWTEPGDGVVFAVGITAGAEYVQPVLRVVNPWANASDRRWRMVSIDLSRYAGQTVRISFHTRSGILGRDDQRGDRALWGAPRIVAVPSGIRP